MKPINIKARIKRNKLDIVAGKNYRNEESEIVKYLRKTNKDAILGIENENGLYTILGEEKVYYRNKNGVEGDISLKTILEILKANALSQAKHGEFDFLKIDEDNSIWLIDPQVMNAMWNTMLLLYDNITS